MRLNQVTLPCTDYTASVRFYQALGLTQLVDSPPRYARFEAPGGTTLSIHQTTRNPESETVVYFEVDDVDAEIARLRDAGLTIEREPVDQPWQWREAHLRDPAGNRLCVFHAGEMRRNPPWRVAAPQ